MFIRDLAACGEFVSGDNTILRELFNPLKDDLELRYSLAHAIVRRGEITHRHRLATSEVYYILQGEGVMHIDDESAPVRAGHAVYIPPRSVQQIRNTGTADLIFLCIVDPAWKSEDEEVIADDE